MKKKGRCIKVSLLKEKFKIHKKNKKIENSLSSNKINSKFISIIKSKKRQFKCIKEAPLCTYRKKTKKASFTLEAAVVIPAFACILASMLFFFRIQEMQIDVQQSLQYAARQTAVSAYEKKLQNSKLLLIEASGFFEKKLIDLSYPKQYTPFHLITLDYLRSNAKKDYIDLYATYQMQLPFSLLGSKTFYFEQRAKARKWTGFEYEQEEEKTKDPMVYITQTGKVYHESKDCTYLKLSIHSVQKKQISQLRNKGGGKYYACSDCKNFGNEVYITDYGTTYHSSLNCHALKRTVYEIKKSQAIEDGYKACSRCGGGG